MDVLAVERCDEGPIDTIDDVVGQVVGFVFQSFDRRDFGIKMGRILKHLLQNGRRGGQPFRQLGEHVVELFVSGKNPQSTVSMKVQNTRDSFKLASARNLARLGLSSYKSAGNAWYRAPNHQASVLEELHEQDSCQKPTDMSPDCDATRQVGAFVKSGSAPTSCQKNHQMRTIQAGIGITLKKMMKKKSILTRTLG